MAGHTLKRRLWRWAPGLFVLSFALSLALFGGSGYAAPDNVHAAVYQWAAQHPGENVPIILRTSGDMATAGATITSFGGEVKQDLAFINAVQADVPAGAVRGVAASSDVSFISLDAPILTADYGGDSGDGGGDRHWPSASPVPTQAPTVPVATPSPTIPVSTPAPTVQASATPTSATPPTPPSFTKSIGADIAWAQNFYGNGVGVAIVDTGISPSTTADFGDGAGGTRIVAQVETSSGSTVTTDGYGHGTHVAGIAAGNGSNSSGFNVGVAPQANLINVKVADDRGGASMGDLVAGLSWVYQNASTYNIRVVNLSLHSSTAESYRTNPLDAAVEMLWFRGIVVVVASGNTGTAAGAVTFPPANDPFVLTIGSIDDKGTTDPADDVVSYFTSRGVTQDGFTKPELYTPGSNIWSTAEPNSVLYQHYLGTPNVQPGPYMMLSGTSMAAGAASGAAALVLQAHPAWTPGQVKCSLTSLFRAVPDTLGAAKVPNLGQITAASAPTCNSDTGITRSYGFGPLIKIGVVAWVLSQPNPADAASALGGNMGKVIGHSTTFSSIKWDSIKWDSIKWDSIRWDVIKWDSIKWDSIKWDSIKWDSLSSDGVNFDSIKWDSIKWDSIKFMGLH